ncbi:hypothetical protein [Exiguobacterium sp. AT1b]|uniref:Uncharacterized protein n=1 Tax=Exiguobacterium sp. (strain ATCC BAA-1283 / AT1b) TaxID=360911 RepID=C4L0N7_EXISA|nr:hypothetical protein [Exiguobacterium sp. AT1b]ACQ68955.1 hypothetical protein EAT1b_0020 [Exiguobacterium sp. AT1b]
MNHKQLNHYLQLTNTALVHQDELAALREGMTIEQKRRLIRYAMFHLKEEIKFLKSRINRTSDPLSRSFIEDKVAEVESELLEFEALKRKYE